MRRLAILLAATALVLAACSSSGDDGTSDTTAAGGDTTTSAAGSAGTGASDTTVDTANLPTYDTVADIGADLQCDLEYDGITDADREYSTCVFQNEQALIYIYTDPTVVNDIVAAGAPALTYGANWTVEVETAPVAQAVADATGGAVAPTTPAG